jgi:POT family proton-dependent oligopeptide transporter
MIDLCCFNVFSLRINNNTHSMKKILSNQHHNSLTFIYAGARALERASFYGLRSILVLYMVHGPSQLPEQNASVIYGAFIGSLMLSQIVGALFGDLLIGNKKALLIGGLLQAFGAFTLCIPSITALYTGLLAVAIGTGLFSPNILCIYGKLYLNKFKLVDSAFTLFYVAVNFGSLIGILLIGFVGEPHYTLGFVASGSLMLITVAVLFFTKEEKVIHAGAMAVGLTGRIFNTVIAIFCLGVFWKMYEFGGYKLLLIEQQLRSNLSDHPYLNNLSSTGVLISGSIAAILWSFLYVSQLKKWALGFLLAGAANGILLLTSGQGTSPSLPIYTLSVFTISISEVLIAPILYSILTKNTNPKYLAIVIALVGLPTAILNYSINVAWYTYIEKSGFEFSSIILGGIGVCIMVYLLLYKRRHTIEEDINT